AESLREEIALAQHREVARAFDAVHTVERAHAVGSLDRIVAVGDLRRCLIERLDAAAGRGASGREARLPRRRRAVRSYPGTAAPGQDPDATDAAEPTELRAAGPPGRAVWCSAQDVHAERCNALHRYADGAPLVDTHVDVLNDLRDIAARR